MKKAILYIHGKGGSAAEAEHYKRLCPEYDVFGLDYQFSTPWETKPEIISGYESLKKCGSVILVANSIGAFFAMNALTGRQIERALLISPYCQYGAAHFGYDAVGKCDRSGAAGKTGN